MGGGTNFALTTSSPSPVADRYVGGTLHTTLPEISIDALPGDGSYGDPITGFRQINRQMADTQRAFSDATARVSNDLNAGFMAQNAARNADQRAQLNETAALSQALRAPLNAPPATGPVLPPNFAETAQAPAMPAPGAMPAADTKAAQLALTTLAPPAQTPAPPAAEPSWLERGWSGVAGAASAAAGAIGQFDRDYGNVLTRGVGAVQAVGGISEAVLGGSLVGLGGAASATGAGAAPGIPAMIGGGTLFANGLDNAQAGLRTVVTGQFQDTLAAEAAGGLVQAAGASPDQAEAARFGANLASGALGLGGGVVAGMRVTGRAAESGVWNLNPFQRGQQIEQTLGHNLPANFPVIDRFENGLATSIKSLDLDATAYQNTSTLSRTLTGYVDKVAGFQGQTWAGVRIRSQDITGRALDLAIPYSGSAAQQAIINQTMNYGASRSVTVNVIIFP